MSFVKWGFDYQPKLDEIKFHEPGYRIPTITMPKITTEVCIDGVPVKKYTDMQRDNKDLIRCLKRVMQHVQMSEDTLADYSEARNLLARMGEADD